MLDRVELLFGTSHDPAEIFEALSSRYTVIAEPSTTERWMCLDTADWRLHRAGMTLRDHRNGRTRELVLSVNGARFTAPAGSGKWPNRADVLAPSPVRDRIEPAAGVRALMPMASVESRRIRLRLLDDVDKTRVRVQIDQQRLADGSRAPLPLRVVLAPLRGYERDARRCTKLLETSIGALVENVDAVSAALVAVGRVPGRTTSPPQVDPSAPAAHAVARVLLSLLDVIDNSRPGVLDDTDVEFLHQLRASVRATRSILSLLGDVLPSAHAAQFAEHFAWLGRLTTPVRDLDVFLLELRGRGGVDVAGLDHLEPLRQRMLRQRTVALRTLRAGMTSRRGRNMNDEWRAVLDGIAASEVPGPPIAEISAQRVQLAYRRVIKAGTGVTTTTPADDLHALRRRCKRMRYLLEGFAPAFEPGNYQAVVTALRRLQDHLGDIQDSDVQCRYLADCAALLARRGASLDTVLAIGALRDRIARRDVEARSDLENRLRRFCAASTKSQVASLRRADT